MAKDWKSAFPREILKRGKKYYETGRVRDFFEIKNYCAADVYGSDIYEVEIGNPGKSNMAVRCDCPYARKGYRCKHEAAVMFKWEEERSKEAEIKYVNASELISEDEPEEAPYFDVKQLLAEYYIEEDRAELARNFVSQDLIKLENIEIGYETYYMARKNKSLSCFLTGKFESGREKSIIEISIDNKDIQLITCRVCGRSGGRHGYSYYDYYGSEYQRNTLCEHAAAMLILADKYFRKYNPGDATDYSGAVFLDSFKQKGFSDVAGKSIAGNESVMLEPRIDDTGGGYELTFRIGNGGKMYVVKNLTELCDIVEQGQSYKLGKTGSIDFAMESFDAYSEKYFELIKSEVQKARATERSLSRRHMYHSENVETKKGIPLIGNVIDTFYEALEGSAVDFKSTEPGSPRYLIITKKNPRIDIDIEGENNDAPAITVSGSLPEFIEGVKRSYYIQNDILSPIEEDDLKVLRPFMNVGSGDYFMFRIGAHNASVFYHRILPELKDSGVFNVSENENISEIINPEAIVEFFLDSEDDNITCKTIVSYDDKTFSLKPLEEEEFPMNKIRDRGREDEIRRLLEEYFETYQVDDRLYMLEKSPEKSFDLIKYGLGRMMAEGEVSTTDEFDKIKVRKKPVVQVGVRMESNLLKLEMLADDMDEEELSEILESFRKKKRFHKLKAGEFVDLEENESLGSLVEMLDSLGMPLKEIVKGKMEIPAYRALYLEEMLKKHEEIVKSRNKVFRNVIRDFKTINDSDFEVPLSLQGTLRPYQEYGYKWLEVLKTAGFGGILADDMGLGKTLQVIALLLAEKEVDGASSSLVVCPASLVYNWMDEIEKFAPELKAAVVVGSKKQRKDVLGKQGEYDILITSYDLLKRDIDLYEDIIFNYQFIDEAQYIKNHSSAAAKTVKLIRAQHKFALTGTPIENRLSELWSIFDYIMPGFLYSYERYRKQIELPISKYKDERAIETLKKMIAPFVLRRRKENVLKDLPEKTEEIRRTALEGKQRKLYDARIMNLRKMLEDGNEYERSKIQVLAELTKIRQICCDPNLIVEGYDGDSAKMEACIDLLTSAAESGHKMLLFSQFTSMLALIEEELKKEGIRFYKITGETSKEERMKQVKMFNQDETPVFLISLKAGGTGLNLTGADMVIHYDPWWNLAAQNQATDRAHRIGQTKNVTVYRLIAKDTIEEKILKIQETKKELADAVLSGEMRSLGAMSKEELMELLE